MTLFFGICFFLYFLKFSAGRGYCPARVRVLANLCTFVLSARICNNLVTDLRARTKVCKICQLRRAIFSVFYNNSQSNFAVLLISIFSF